MRDEASVKRALRDWIVRTNGRIDAAVVTDGTPLVAQGILRSVDVLELVLFLEELLERTIDVERIVPGSFGSIDAIYRSFFGEDGRAA